MNLTSQALVGIIVKENDEGLDSRFYSTLGSTKDLSESNEMREMQKKMTIFVCDDDFDVDLGEEKKSTRFVQ